MVPTSKQNESVNSEPPILTSAIDWFSLGSQSFSAMMFVRFWVAIVMILIDVHMQVRMLSKQPIPARFGDCRIIHVQRF